MPSRGIRLQDRDIAILDALRVHRYARSEHIHGLLFGARTLRSAQKRLRTLWEHGFLDRYYLPIMLAGGEPLPRTAPKPIYTLSVRGADLLSERLSIPCAEIPHGLRQKPRGFPTIQHHLAVTDFMVALRLACRTRADVCLESLEHEHVLWRRLADAPADLKRDGIAVPDGAFTLILAKGPRLTFHLEIVRAGVKGGNKGLKRKLALYTKLNRRGFFRHAYGHKRLRAVLIATTSAPRADRFRLLAENLKHGRLLFWFGAYQIPGPAREPKSAFTPETVLGRLWTTAEGNPAGITDTAREQTV